MKSTHDCRMAGFLEGVGVSGHKGGRAIRPDAEDGIRAGPTMA